MDNLRRDAGYIVSESLEHPSLTQGLVRCCALTHLLGASGTLVAQTKTWRVGFGDEMTQNERTRLRLLMENI
jgi:hypothetical protein